MKRVLFFLVLFLLPLAVNAADFRVGVMPAKESLPFYAEEKLGIFKKQGINLIVIPFRSALERDAAFEAGKIDGAVNDIVGTALLSRAGRNVKILRTIAAPGKNQPIFRVLRKKEAGEAREIAVSFNTVIEYVTDRILEKHRMEGLKKTEIKSVPLRMQLLLEGKVGYATIAEPLATFAQMKGAQTVYTDEDVKGSHVLFMARGDMDGRTLKSVVTAYDEICAEANRRKGELKELLWAKLSLPPELKDQYLLPDVAVKEVPKKEEVLDVLSWMQKRGLIKDYIEYDNMVYRQ
jgi:NitT/TauT family transport system substrate-binding protein